MTPDKTLQFQVLFLIVERLFGQDGDLNSEPIIDALRQAAHALRTGDARERARAIQAATDALDAAKAIALGELEISRDNELDGASTLNAWVRNELRLNAGQASALSRNVTALDELPAVAEAAVAGRISAAHVRVFVYGIRHVGLETMREFEEVFVAVALENDPAELTCCTDADSTSAATPSTDSDSPTGPAVLYADDEEPATPEPPDHLSPAAHRHARPGTTQVGSTGRCSTSCSLRGLSPAHVWWDGSLHGRRSATRLLSAVVSGARWFFGAASESWDFCRAVVWIRTAQTTCTSRAHPGSGHSRHSAVNRTPRRLCTEWPCS